MKKILKWVKNNLLGFIICAVMFSAIGVVAATLISSSEVSYNNANSGSSATTVKGALDELYNMAQNCTSGTTGSSTMTYSFGFNNVSSTTNYNAVKDKDGNIKNYFMGYQNGKYYVCVVVNNKVGCFKDEDDVNYTLASISDVFGVENCSQDSAGMTTANVVCTYDTVKCKVAGTNTGKSSLTCGSTSNANYKCYFYNNVPYCT